MLGTVVSALLRLVFTADQVQSYGWRIGYILGFGIGIFGKWLRKGLEESPEFEQAKAELASDNVAPSNPLRDAFTKYHKEVLMVMTTVSIWCTGFYTCFVWIGTFYGIVNDPEAVGEEADTELECTSERHDAISNPFLVTSAEMVLLILLL
eukprot:SAG31_NODE_2225_length_6150_cov_2.229549_6_plen_151_part_00